LTVLGAQVLALETNVVVVVRSFWGIFSGRPFVMNKKVIFHKEVEHKERSERMKRRRQREGRSYQRFFIFLVMCAWLETLRSFHNERDFMRSIDKKAKRSQQTSQALKCC